MDKTTLTRPSRVSAATLDLPVLSVAALIIITLAAVVDTNSLIDWLGKHDESKIDKVMISSVAGAILLAVFAVRRWHEARRELLERQRVELELRLGKHGAEADTRATSEFLANMRHEIRTPPNGVIGMVDLAPETNRTDEQRDYIETARASSYSSLRVINDILDFSKIEAGKLELDNADFHLQDSQAGSASTEMEFEARERRARAFFKKPPQLNELTPTAAQLSGHLDQKTSARILVVDDESLNCELLQEILSREGWQVSAAGDGLASLEEFKRVQPDLVLLDVQMPLLDGFQVCRRLKSDPDTRLIPVVLMTALSAVEDRVRGIAAGADDFLTKPVDRSQLVARVRSLLSLKRFTDELERAESILFALASSIEGKDPYTEGHCERLSDYASRLARTMGLTLQEVIALQRAGTVHDIGKVAVADAILLKPGPLTREEREIMQQHVIVGERICAPLKSFGLVLPIIRHHHEKMDGSGYPDGLIREQIPHTVRILQIVDVYDALTTERPYKHALTSSAALSIMREEVRKGWWDAEVFAEFEAMMSAGVPPQKFFARGIAAN